MYERILQRYLLNYVTDEQLMRYVALGVITQEQAETIQASK